MTKKEYEEILEYAIELLVIYPEWRWGQAVFNTMFTLYPEEANNIRGTKLDMFYRDENVEKYKLMINEI